jgi:hypothetical protein
MLNAKAISKSFVSCMCTGIENIFLVNKTGSLVLSAKHVDPVKTLGAILSNVWTDYAEAIGNQEAGQELKFMIVELEGGTVVVESVSGLYLCVQGTGEIGRIIEVGKKVIEMIESPLNEVFSS